MSSAVFPQAKPKSDTHPCVRPFETPDIYWVLALALLARFTVCMLSWSGTQALETALTARYAKLGASLIERATYSEGGASDRSPSTALPPAYPVFLALQWTLIGESPHAQVLLQALLGMLTCGFIYATAHGLLKRPAALLAGVVAALDPDMVFHSLLFSHEGLYLFFLALGGWALLQAFKHDYPWAWAAAGAALGLAALTWYDALWTWLPVALCIAIWRRHRPAGYATRAACFLAAFAALTALWTGRNALAARRLVFASDAGRRWIENRAAAVPMRTQGVSRQEAVALLYDDLSKAEGERDGAGVDLSRARRARAISLLAAHPSILARLWASGAYRSLTDSEPSLVEDILGIWFLKPQNNPFATCLYVCLASGFQWLLLATIVAGGIHHRSWRAGFVWWGPVLYAAYFLPFMADLEPGVSLRLPLLPALAILAAREIECYWPWVMRRFRYHPERFGTVVYDGPIIGKSDEGGGAL